MRVIRGDSLPSGPAYIPGYDPNIDPSLQAPQAPYPYPQAFQQNLLPAGPSALYGPQGEILHRPPLAPVSLNPAPSSPYTPTAAPQGKRVNFSATTVATADAAQRTRAPNSAEHRELAAHDPPRNGVPADDIQSRDFDSYEDGDEGDESRSEDDDNGSGSGSTSGAKGNGRRTSSAMERIMGAGVSNISVRADTWAVRNSTRSTIKPRAVAKRPLTEAQKVAREFSRQKTRERDSKLGNDVDQFLDERKEKMEEIASTNGVTFRKVADMVNTNTNYKKKRAPNLFNAKLHLQALESNEGKALAIPCISYLLIPP